jgi:hypothetical protein
MLQDNNIGMLDICHVFFMTFSTFAGSIALRCKSMAVARLVPALRAQRNKIARQKSLSRAVLEGMADMQ